MYDKNKVIGMKDRKVLDIMNKIVLTNQNHYHERILISVKVTPWS